MDNVIIHVKDSTGNVVTLTVSKEIAERMKNDQKFLSSVMEKVKATEMSKALISGPGSIPKVTQPTTLCTTSTSTRSPVPLNLCVKPPSPPPPSTSQCSITTTRPPVPLTPSVSVPVSATLQASEATQRSSTSIQSDSQESHQEMTHKITLLLLDLTKTYQHLYFRNKPAFYQKLRTAFTQKGYNLSTEKIRKKLSNMLTTYKRVKDRRRATGEGKNAWEYYTLMDELFGSSGIGTAPPGTIYSTPLFSEATSSNKSTTLQDQQPPPVQDQPAEDEHPGTSAMQSTTNPTSRQRRQTQSSQFLESYEAHAERRTAVLETLVRPDFERWRRLKERRRRSFERKMLTSMGTIVEELKKISKHQEEQIIHLLQNQPQ